jgi:hypothetical protein
VGLMAPVGFEPTTNGLCLPLRLSPRSDPPEAEVCGPDYPFTLRVCRLVSTPSPLLARLGSGLPYCFRNPGFPEFGRFYKRA